MLGSYIKSLRKTILRTQVSFYVVIVGCLITFAFSAKAQSIRIDRGLIQFVERVDYRKDGDEFFGQIKALYFAVGCKVVPAEASLIPYIRGIRGAFDARTQESGVHPNETGRMKQAAREGMAKAKEVGACEFWRQHPEMARGIRTLAKTGH